MPRGQVKDHEMLRRRMYDWIRAHPDNPAPIEPVASVTRAIEE